jgi:anti-sigma28 factor (negative regulator of flagellin synthesis)
MPRRAFRQRSELASEVLPTGQEGAARTAAAGDEAQLSVLKGRISEAMEADAAARAGRVASIAKAVQSGAYRVDARAVGRALVNEAVSGGESK